MKLSIIIPIYNEQESLDSLFNELSGLFADESGNEIIFINDGSTDKNLSILEKKIKNLRYYLVL